MGAICRFVELKKIFILKHFRKFLSPASGFQSLQFRLLENKLGLQPVKIISTVLRLTDILFLLSILEFASTVQRPALQKRF